MVKTEVVDKSRMFKIVALVMLGEHAINAIWNIASIYYQMPFLSLNCAGKSMEGPMLYQGFIILKTLVVMIIGVVFDVLLAKFLEKRTVFPTLPPLNAKNVQNGILRFHFETFVLKSKRNSPVGLYSELVTLK